MHTKVHAVRGNIRYRVLEIDNYYYLVDLEENLLFYLIPFLTWFHTYNIYEIDEALAKTFTEKGKGEKEKEKERKAQTKVLLPIALSLSIVFGRMLIGMGVNDIIFFQSTVINIITLTLTVLSISYFWSAMYRQSEEKLKSFLTDQSLQSYRAKFYPKKKKEYFQMLFFMVFLLFFISGTAVLLLTEGLLIGIICFALFLVMYSIMFRLHIHVGKDYKGVFID